jgi:hypothetical protein
MDTRFRTWNVSSLYREGSLKTVARDLAKYKLDLAAVQRVRLVERGGQPADDHIVSMEIEKLMIT